MASVLLRFAFSIFFRPSFCSFVFHNLAFSSERCGSLCFYSCETDVKVRRISYTTESETKISMVEKTGMRAKASERE